MQHALDWPHALHVGLVWHAQRVLDPVHGAGLCPVWPPDWPTGPAEFEQGKSSRSLRDQCVGRGRVSWGPLG